MPRQQKPAPSSAPEPSDTTRKKRTKHPAGQPNTPTASRARVGQKGGRAQVVVAVPIAADDAPGDAEREAVTAVARAQAIPPRRDGQRLTPEQRVILQDAFLKEFAVSGNARAACQAIGINRSTFYDWRDNDAAFSERLQVAESDAIDVLRAAAFRRAVQGVPEPVVSGGRLVYEYIPLVNDDGSPKRDRTGKPMYQRGKLVTVTRYSDTLLLALLRARAPEFKAQASLDVTANGEAIRPVFVLPHLMPLPDAETGIIDALPMPGD